MSKCIIYASSYQLLRELLSCHSSHFSLFYNYFFFLWFFWGNNLLLVGDTVAQVRILVLDRLGASGVVDDGQVRVLLA